MAFAASRRLAALNLVGAVPFLLVALIIVTRNPFPFLRGGFWAEDGLVFFPEALTQGWQSLYTPVYGYQFLLSRLIAYSATFFPVVAAPYIYAAACLFFNVLAIGYFSLKRFSWVIPSRAFRIFVCLLLATAPGAGEVMMNLCNLMTPLSLLAILILLEDPATLSWPRFWAVLFLALSAAPVQLQAPLFLYLLWRSRNRRYLWLFISVCPVFIANALGNHLTGSHNGLLNYHYAIAIPRVLADNFVLRLFLLPVLGATLTAQVMVATASAFWLSSLAGAVALYLLWRRGSQSDSMRAMWADRSVALLLIAYACAISTFAAIVVSRSYAAHQIVRQFGNPLWYLRYAYLPGAIAILLWATVLHRLVRYGPLYTGAAFVVLSIMATNHLKQWNSYPARRDVQWEESARLIQESIDARGSGSLVAPVTVRVPVHPAHWNGGAMSL